MVPEWRRNLCCPESTYYDCDIKLKLLETQVRVLCKSCVDVILTQRKPSFLCQSDHSKPSDAKRVRSKWINIQNMMTISNKLSRCVTNSLKVDVQLRCKSHCLWLLWLGTVGSFPVKFDSSWLESYITSGVYIHNTAATQTHTRSARPFDKNPHAAAQAIKVGLVSQESGALNSTKLSCQFYICPGHRT